MEPPPSERENSDSQYKMQRTDSCVSPIVFQRMQKGRPMRAVDFPASGPVHANVVGPFQVTRCVSGLPGTECHVPARQQTEPHATGVAA